MSCSDTATLRSLKSIVYRSIILSAVHLSSLISVLRGENTSTDMDEMLSEHEKSSNPDPMPDPIEDGCGAKKKRAVVTLLVEGCGLLKKGLKTPPAVKSCKACKMNCKF